MLSCAEKFVHDAADLSYGDLDVNSYSFVLTDNSRGIVSAMRNGKMLLLIR